jgi:thioredoxin:protein disulfide reductase
LKTVWKPFVLKVAAWAVAAAAVHFLTATFLGAPLSYVVSGILILGALHMALLDRTPLPVAEGRMLKRGVALLLVAFAAWLQIEPFTQSRISWIAYSDDVLEMAQRTRRSVMIDFTSRNCPPCLEMERKVFTHRRVGEAAKEFLTVRADLTAQTAANQKVAERFGIKAYPTIVFLGPDGKERHNLRLVGFENATFFAERVESAR